MSKDVKYYYPIDKQTNEVLVPVKAEYRGGMYHIPRDALQSEPLPPKQGFAVVAVLDNSGQAIKSKYIEDHRGTTIYDESNCTVLSVVSDLGPIKEGFTTDKPITDFDEWISGAWVTNQSNKYIAEYDQVDSARRAAYREVSDPLYMEAWRKESKGLVDEAAAFRQQADAAVELIQAEHPWPTLAEVA
ncbi:hypothetical protein [Vibrio scophthalmi]|uniref:Tail fiber assembly protein n=1 Tax=Vibrio scophthalmi LMG 19158 TaxID=870967 RepID=F9RKS2_9VIBR|nr:hypothetical protein [Vibrio scophthalmi]EGU39396.1 hypothetical protein VIS19158_03861 [Vibrio scophthalmi LMG 19158]